MENYKNKLFVFEGSDATGKTTIAKMFVEHLNNHGIPTIFTFQPGDTEYGVHASMFRSMCKDSRWDLHELTNFFIFFADKIEQITKVVQPALQAGKTVVSDRWWHSTYAYQYYGKQIMEKYHMPHVAGEWLNNVSELFRPPDATFLFPEKISLPKGERVSDANGNDNFETQDFNFFNRVRIGYEKLYQLKPNFYKVSPGSSPEEALDNVLSIDI